jgi:hypothetical protein
MEQVGSVTKGIYDYSKLKGLGINFDQKNNNYSN